MAIYRIEDGKIAEDWHTFDSMGLWRVLIPEIGQLVDEAIEQG
jgi:hypothetical protein